MKLSLLLKNLRLARGLTPTEAYRAIGINRMLLWRLENTDQRPKVNTLKKLADFYGLTIDQLIS